MAPGVDSASKRNEYQEYFLGDKGDRCVRLTTLPLHVLIVLESGNLNLLETSGPVQPVEELLYLYTFIPLYLQLHLCIFVYIMRRGSLSYFLRNKNERDALYFQIDSTLILLAASQSECTMNTTDCIYSKPPPEDQQSVYSKHVEDIIGINLKRKCISLVFSMQIYHDARSI